MPKNLQTRAERLGRGRFLGGPVETFEAIGRLQLISLLRCGLEPDSRVLDLGCGSLRGGYWIIHFLEPGCYFGIEPDVRMLEFGRKEILGADLISEKRPRFLTNEAFDPGEFGEKFDFLLARSIWTHASRGQIRAMLDAFVTHGADDAVFLTSYLPTQRGEPGHAGEEWVGRSHRSEIRGVVRQDLRWIEQECHERKLTVRELPVDRKRQTWLLIAKGEGATPTTTYLAELFTPDVADRSLYQRWKKSLRRGIHRFAGGAARR